MKDEFRFATHLLSLRKAWWKMNVALALAHSIIYNLSFQEGLRSIVLSFPKDKAFLK
jgi:hypothetical protein